MLWCAVQAFTCPQVARMLTGFTKLRHYDAEISARLANAAERDMANGSGVHLAQVMWCLAHQRFEQPSVFEAASIQVGGGCWVLSYGTAWGVGSMLRSGSQ